MMNMMVGAMLVVGAVQSDTTFAAGDASRLFVESEGGSVTVATWDRPEIRIEADHSSRTFIQVRRRGATIDVEPESRRGPATIVDFVITVPTGFDLGVEGGWTDITIDGAGGEVEVETYQGDVRINGGRGVVRAVTVNGELRVSNAHGRLELEGVAEPIYVESSSGELYAENVGGGIRVQESEFEVAELGSVGGRIVYDGGIAEEGRYFFGSHGGPVMVRVPDGSGARIAVATIWGTVNSSLAGSPGEFPQGERTRFEIGSGTAELEVETYGGRITLTSDPLPAVSMGRGGRDGLDLLVDATVDVGTMLGVEFGELISNAVTTSLGVEPSPRSSRRNRGGGNR